MATGSSVGRANNKGGFDFASDDILCTYEDYGDQEASNGNHSDPAIGANSSKDFHKDRLSSSPVLPSTNVYTQPADSLNQELIVTVERTMKNYADNLMRFLEGISSRLSQLELYCYNLDKSIGEMRSELARDNGEADVKLKSLEKHMQEVQRSVQILRDKQELAETQKELAKLQLAQKESSRSQQEEKVFVPVSLPRNKEEPPEMHNQQLALALPSQLPPPQPSFPSRAPEQQHSVTAAPPSHPPISHQPPYYLSAPQLPNPAVQHQPRQGPYPTADSHYRPLQIAQNPQQGQANQSPQVQQFPQYQQQWSQPRLQPAQPQPMQSQSQIRTPPPSQYPPYLPNQPTNPPQETLPGSMAMQMPYGYGGSNQAHQHMKGSDGFPAPPQISSGGSYVIYDNERNRTHHSNLPAVYSQGGFQQPHSQPPSSAGLVMRGPSPAQLMRSHSELIDKLVSMGYRGDHVVSVIQRLEENRQPVDFNAVLDRLNGHSSGTSQRSW